MATALCPRTVRNPQFWDHAPPFPDADGHRAIRREDDRRQLGDQRWTLTPLAEQLDPLAFAPEIEQAAAPIRSAWTLPQRLFRGRHLATDVKFRPYVPDEPKRRLRTRHMEDVQRLYDAGLSQREIARELRIARATVADRVEQIEQHRNAQGGAA